MCVCSCPFQIMTAIILAIENEKKADIYITQSFHDDDRYVDAVEKQEYLHKRNFEISNSRLANKKSTNSDRAKTQVLASANA